MKTIIGSDLNSLKPGPVLYLLLKAYIRHHSGQLSQWGIRMLVSAAARDCPNAVFLQRGDLLSGLKILALGD